VPFDDIRESSEPFDRLTELCKTMTDSIETEENAEVKGIIFLNEGERAGIQLFGYDTTVEGMADLLVHLKALFASQGKQFGVMTDQGFMLMDEVGT
jgi:hypothetical protein